MQENPIEDSPSKKLKCTSVQNHDGMLVCNKLLSARCVRQQIMAIKQQQSQDGQIADRVSSQQCSKKGTMSDLQEAMQANRQAGCTVTKGCSNTEKTAPGGCTDAMQPAVDPQSNTETTGAAAATSSCIRQEN